MPRSKDHDSPPSPSSRPHGSSGSTSVGAGHAGARQVADLGRSKNAGSQPPGAHGDRPALTTPYRTPGSGLRPTGFRTEAHPAKARDLGLRRENEASDTIAAHGYDIEQNPPAKENGKNPDYRIEGEYFDCLSPQSNNPEKIRNRLSQKFSEGQAERFVLNMADTTCSLEQVVAVLRRKPIAGLKEILVVKDGSVMPFYPFGE